MSPETLVRTAQEKGIDVLALTDINNTSCSIEFVERCKEAGIKPIVGIEFRKDNRLLYIGLAKNHEGFYELNQLLTKSSLEDFELPDLAPPMKNTFIIYPELRKDLAAFAENEFLGIRRMDVVQLFRSPLLEHRDRLVIWQPVTFADNDEKHLLAHRFLRSIDRNILLSKLEDDDCADASEYLFSKTTLLRHYLQYPFLIENTRALIDSCEIDFEYDVTINRQTFTGDEVADFTLLERLTWQGCRRRYGEHNREAIKRVRQELKVIREQHFCAYFLITWDIVKYAKTSDYWHVGRGSGANSIVAYCIGITDVEPIELDLYFERFINPYRTSPPDFDIDFSWRDRDDVIDYIYNRYRSQYVALMATYSTFNFKSIVRELGKVYGLPKGEMDKIIANPTSVKKHHELSKVIFQYGELIDGFPNYLSIHAGGVLISQKPLNYHTSLKLMPKGFPITHFDMHHGEQWGFHKYDILSQRGLGHIRDAISLVRKNQGRAVLVDRLDEILADEKVKSQLRSGYCIGCFYVESPAMRGLLSKLKCDSFKHLVAASSIIRPGVAKSGMMKEYIRRFHDPTSVKYLHPVFEKHLGETFGVMVYQEDTLKILHHFAGLDLGESDVLRRIMTGKKYKKDTLINLHQKYLKNCQERGYSKALADEVWRQVKSFSGYSFCKAHSASFAVESFQSLYLKAYFPIEHAVAVTNNFGGFYKSEFYLHEARIHGATLHPPCVNHSEWLVSLEQKDVYIGFVFIKELQRNVVTNIVLERYKNGDYKDLKDFTQRVELSTIQLDLLIRIGAFRFTQKSKCELMWEKGAYFNQSTKNGSKNTSVKHLSLFADETENFEIPRLEENEFDQAFDEIELLGFPLCSPFKLLQNQGLLTKVITAAQLKTNIGRMVKMLGYYVCRKSVRTVKGDMMAFGTWIDSEGTYFDTTHFAQALERFPLRGKGIYLIEGRVTQEFDFPSVEVTRVFRQAYRVDKRY